MLKSDKYNRINMKGKTMNSKNLAKRLYTLGYTLNRYPLGGWMVVSVHTGFQYRFPTLEGVNRFVVDEEAMGMIITQ